MTNNREINTSYGRVSNISNKKLRKKKLIKNGILAISGAAIVLVSSLFIADYIDSKKINDVPEGQTVTTISMQVESGDTISEIASKFYTDECEGVYNSVSNYENDIMEQNHISKYNPLLQSGDMIEIPVVVDKENPYYLQISELQSRIAEIEENNKWIRHTVQSGELISTLAELASGDISETYEIMDEIFSKNNISKNQILSEGQEIWIVNPELGELKTELNEVQQLFIQSLTNNQIKK